MKFCAFVLLLTLCYLQSATADPKYGQHWNHEAELRYRQEIKDIIHKAVVHIDARAHARGTAVAKACAQHARSDLSSIERNGLLQVSQCLRTPGQGKVCARSVVSGVSTQAQNVSKAAIACIRQAH